MAKLGGMGGGDPTRDASTIDPKLPRGLKMGYTWDIAMACVFYVSPAGGYVSGDIMVVDGGNVLRRGVKIAPDGHLDVNRQFIRDLARGRESSQKQSGVGVAGAKSKL